MRCLNDSRGRDAKVIGMIPTRSGDLKVSLTGCRDHAGNSRALQVGDQVVAIGNPFGGADVTSGIVSDSGQQSAGINTLNFIQTTRRSTPQLRVHGGVAAIWGNKHGDYCVRAQKGHRLRDPVSTAKAGLKAS